MNGCVDIMSNILKKIEVIVGNESSYYVVLIRWSLIAWRASFFGLTRKNVGSYSEHQGWKHRWMHPPSTSQTCKK